MTNKLLSFVVFLSGIICAAQTQSPNKVSQEIYSNPEVKAEFPQGIKKFYSFITDNFLLPELDEDIEAKFYFSFVIENDGSLNDVTVIRDPGYGMGEELVRVVKLSPKWNPARQNGNPVRSKITLPLTISVKGRPKNATVQDTIVYNMVDIKPEYPGGMGQLHKDVMNQLRLPDVKQDLDVKIFISFIVDSNGILKDIKCTRDPGYGLGAEAVRAVRQISAKWAPAIQNGVPVACSMTLPIVVRIKQGVAPPKTKHRVFRNPGPPLNH